MVHRVYMCSNLKSPFIAHKYDQLMGCNSYNLVMSNSPDFVIEKHIKFEEDQHCWLLPTTCPPTKLKPRMVCCQEGKDDEDMTPSDTTIDDKVSSFICTIANSKNRLLPNDINMTRNYGEDHK